MSYVKAWVRFFTPEEGGRPVPPSGDGYAPYLRTSTGHQDLAIRINGIPAQGGQFGVPYDVEIELSYHPALDYSVVQPGASFSLMEGPKVVGEGKVISSRYEKSPSQ